MEGESVCPECGGVWGQGESCEGFFHQLLFWEGENPAYGEVHHLMVLCYHLQHPRLYSPEGLESAKGLLVDFEERGLTTEQVRKRQRDVVASGNRSWKITARPGSYGSYAHAVSWPMVAGDVIAAGADRYCDSVRGWARSVHATLKATGNLRAE